MRPYPRSARRGMTTVKRVSELVLEARKVDCGYGDRLVLRGLDLQVAGGEFLGVIGPNGAGKSTLLRVLSGVLAPHYGEVLLQGRALRKYRRRDIARLLAVVPPPTSPLFSFGVRDFVAMGRTPYLGPLQGDRPEDQRVIVESMEATDTTHLAEAVITELSSGEWQRVNVARALAQEPQILLLDEPTAFLDLAHQRKIFELLVRLNAERHLTVLCISHDLNLASEYCLRIVVLTEGQICADGTPEEVITEEIIAHVYGAPVRVDRGPAGKPHLALLSEAALERERERP